MLENHKANVEPLVKEFQTGSKAVGQKRFITLLMDCCKSQLGMTNVFTFTRKGMPLFKGLAIRKSDIKYKEFATILPEGKESE